MATVNIFCPSSCETARVFHRLMGLCLEESKHSALLEAVDHCKEVSHHQLEISNETIKFIDHCFFEL